MTDAISAKPAETSPSSANAGGLPSGSAPIPAWTQGLEPELRAMAASKGWRGMGDALKSYAHLERAFGADKIAVPGSTARPEEWAVLYDRLGRPEKPDGYDLGDFAPPEGLAWNGDVQAAMLAEMHHAGLNSAQVRRILGKYAALQGANAKQTHQSRAAAVENSRVQLRETWGTGYEARVDLANRAFRAAFAEDADMAASIRLDDGSALGDHPAVVRAFAHLGELMSEDRLVGAKGGSRFGLSPEDARAEIARIHGDTRALAILMDKAHPEYEALVRRRNALFAVAYPE
jgi:hypothetical protein